jgi:hypothetical protein
MGPVFEEIEAALAEDRFDDARVIVNTLFSFEPMIRAGSGMIDVTTAAAFALGVANFRDGKFDGELQREVPQEVENAANQLRGMFEDKESMRRTAVLRLQEAITRLQAQALAEEDMDTGDAPFESIFRVADPVLAKQMNAAVAQGKQLIDIGSNLITTRLIAFGALSEAANAGISQYQITEVLDGVTCPVCLMMHGKIHTVAQPLERLRNQLLSSGDPEQLRQIAFPAQSQKGLRRLANMNDGELQGRGWDTPPFHPNCRGQLVPVGTVKGEDILGFNAPNPRSALAQTPAGSRVLSALGGAAVGAAIAGVGDDALGETAADEAIGDVTSEEESAGASVHVDTPPPDTPQVEDVTLDTAENMTQDEFDELEPDTQIRVNQLRTFLGLALLLIDGEV